MRAPQGELVIKVNDTLASRIVGLGSFLPDQVLANDDIAGMLETSDEWIRSRTGIGSRHRAARHESNTVMGAEAARRAIADAGLSPKDIGLVIYGTMFPEYTYPGPGALLLHELNIGCAVPAFDIRAQCAGFVYALSMADLYIRSQQVQYVLCVFSERQFDHYQVDRQVGVIFGDGAGAAVLGPSEGGYGVWATDLGADGSGAEDLIMTSDNTVGIGCPENHCPSELHKLRKYWDEKGWISGVTQFPYMTGQEVFRAAVRSMSSGVRSVLEARHLTLSQVDRFFFHQANLRINSRIQKLLGLSDEKVPCNIERVGNLGAASIPVLMDEEKRAGRLHPGDLCALAAFGAGYLWGTVLLTF